MNEFTNIASQSIAAGGNCLFAETVSKDCSVSHRTGSGLFTLHGNKKYLINFSGNLAGATADTEVDLAFTVNGETLAGTTMASTPAAANAENNVSKTFTLTVPCSCCYNIAVENIGTAAVTVSAASLVISRLD